MFFSLFQFPVLCCIYIMRNQLTSAFLESKQDKNKTLQPADKASGSSMCAVCVCVFECVPVLLQTNGFIIQTFSAVNQPVSQRNHGDGAFTNGRSVRMGAHPETKSVWAQQVTKQAHPIYTTCGCACWAHYLHSKDNNGNQYQLSSPDEAETATVCNPSFPPLHFHTLKDGMWWSKEEEANYRALHLPSKLCDVNSSQTEDCWFVSIIKILTMTICSPLQFYLKLQSSFLATRRQKNSKPNGQTHRPGCYHQRNF